MKWQSLFSGKNLWFILLTILRRCPGVSLTLCCFVVYSMICFKSCLVLFCSCVFQSFYWLLALRLPRLGKRELILVLFVRLFDLLLFGFSVSSSSWCLERAAAFLLPLFVIVALPGLSIYLFLENLVHKYVFNFRDNNVITTLQSGFVPGDSAVNQLFDIYNTFCKAHTCN